LTDAAESLLNEKKLQKLLFEAFYVENSCHLSL